MRNGWMNALLAIDLGIWIASHAAAAEHLSDDSSEPKRLKLVFITCCVDQAFFGPVKRGMRDAAEMLDVDCEFRGTPGVDVAAQIALVRAAMAEGCDGIALNLIDPEAFDNVVAEATEKGIPVVAFNVDDSATPNARLAAVSQRFYEAGQTLARRAIGDVPSGTRVLLTKHDEGVSALEERLRGIQDVLKSKQVTWITIVTGNDAEKGSAVVADALRKNPDIRIVFSSGQSDTEAVGRAIESDFADGGYWSAGFDLSPKTLQLVRDGHIRFTVDQQPYAQGFYPVVALALNLRYGIMPSDIDAGAAIIDRTNVDRVRELTAKGHR